MSLKSSFFSQVFMRIQANLAHMSTTKTRPTPSRGLCSYYKMLDLQGHTYFNTFRILCINLYNVYQEPTKFT